MRKALALAGLLVLTACGTQGGGIEPPGNIAVTDVLTRDALTLGPDGHAVELGASEAEVTAAGWTVRDQPAPGRAQDCPEIATIQLPNGEDGTLTISAKAGVSHISAGGDMHTPEGVRIHSLAADVTKAYPEVKDAGSGADLTVPVPGNPQASYVIKFQSGQVLFLDLKLNDTDC
ncbi:hypothetical protein [Actinocrispum sp. NPDC049592]|uniref:hypothetical protein n=1 Tax=Actinocrispum sp. NPDC049592 TaxID=3154835 RepID=UPI00342277CE